VGKRRVNFQRCWLPVSRIGLHRRGVERVNCGPKLLDLGEKGVYSSYTYTYEKLKRNYQAMLELVCSIIWLDCLLTPPSDRRESLESNDNMAEVI